MRGKRSRRWLLPWCLAFAALLNLAYPMYVHYDFSHSLDTRGYLRMATARFDSVSVTRRYRVLVPAAAAAVAAPVAKVYGRIWPQRPAGLWPLRFSFYLVNCILLAAAAACWYNGARQVGAAPKAAGLALLAVLSSRWAVYAAGLPLTDSLYLLVFGLAYYAVKRGREASWAMAACLLLGPLAKESFVFLLPWLLWFGRKALPWPKQLLFLATGGLALAGVHYFIDSSLAAPPTQAVSNAFEHLENIGYSLRRAASPKGIGELLSIFGLLTFVPFAALAALGRPRFLQLFRPVCGATELGLYAVAAVHMLLSGDLGRMGYLSAPAFVAVLSLILTHWSALLRSDARHFHSPQREQQ